MEETKKKRLSTATWILIILAVIMALITVFLAVACIPFYGEDPAPIAADPEDVRPYFRQMRSWFDRLRDQNIDNISMDVLSMGMSADCVVAAEEGATIVRLGRALFGARN